MDVFCFPYSDSKTGWLLECQFIYVKGSKLPLVINLIVGFYIAIIRIPVIKGGRPLHMSSPSMPCKGDVPAESFGFCNQSMQRSKRGAKSRHWYVAREVIFVKRYMLICYEYMIYINEMCIVKKLESQILLGRFIADYIKVSLGTVLPKDMPKKWSGR